MKNTKIKIMALAIALFAGISFSCEQENDELLKEEGKLLVEESSPNNDGITSKAACSNSNPLAKNFNGVSNCTPGKKNPCTRDVDLSSPVNTGKVDDRTCHQDYYELTKFNKTYGNYRIADDSNHWDSPGTLQPRIERSYPRANSKIGSKFTFTGTFIIERVGSNSNFDRAGTYIAQTKGKFDTSGTKDPAICLYLAKKNAQGNFDIYAERITYRTTGSDGREIVYLTTVTKGSENTFEVRMGFREVGPANNRTKQHYCNTFINGTPYYWNIQEPNRGTQSGFRYGAYRCQGGSAHIRWANTVYNLTNK